MSPRIPKWVAWRTGSKGFGRFHRIYESDHGVTVCGKRPEGITDIRVTMPKVKDECVTCCKCDYATTEWPKGAA